MNQRCSTEIFFSSILQILRKLKKGEKNFLPDQSSDNFLSPLVKTSASVQICEALIDWPTEPEGGGMDRERGGKKKEEKERGGEQ